MAGGCLPPIPATGTPREPSAPALSATASRHHRAVPLPPTAQTAQKLLFPCAYGCLLRDIPALSAWENQAPGGEGQGTGVVSARGHRTALQALPGPAGPAGREEGQVWSLERGSWVSLHLPDPTTKHDDLLKRMALLQSCLSNLSQVPLSARPNPTLAWKETRCPGLTRCPGSLQVGRGAPVFMEEWDYEAGVGKSESPPLAMSQILAACAEGESPQWPWEDTFEVQCLDSILTQAHTQPGTPFLAFLILDRCHPALLTSEACSFVLLSSNFSNSVQNSVPTCLLENDTLQLKYHLFPGASLTTASKGTIP